MNFDRLRALCLSMPHATEDVQWGSDLLFRIRGKIFVSCTLEPTPGALITVKCSLERGAELLEREGVERAAYVGRYGWISMQGFRPLTDGEWKDAVQASYEMIAAKTGRSKQTTRAATIKSRSRPAAPRMARTRPQNSTNPQQVNY